MRGLTEHERNALESGDADFDDPAVLVVHELLKDRGLMRTEEVIEDCPHDQDLEVVYDYWYTTDLGDLALRVDAAARAAGVV